MNLPCVLSVDPGGQKGPAGKRQQHLRIRGSAAKTAEGKADAERDVRVCAGEVNVCHPDREQKTEKILLHFTITNK